MQELNITLFNLVNATSDTPLWLLDWGRFLTWWPQIFALGSLVILFLRKNECNFDWLGKVLAVLGLSVGLNHALSWGLPLIAPDMAGIGQLWMKGATFGNWMGDYPGFLPSVFLACLMGTRGYFFRGWLFTLVAANVWGVMLVGTYLPSHIILGCLIGALSLTVVYGTKWAQERLRRSNLDSMSGLGVAS